MGGFFSEFEAVRTESRDRDAPRRLGFDRQAAPLEAFLSTCVEKRRGENKVKRAKRAKVVAAQAAAAATEEPQAPQPPLGPALLGPQPI